MGTVAKPQGLFWPSIRTLGTWHMAVASIMRLALPPSSPVDPLDPCESHRRGAHGCMGTSSCRAAWCAGASPSPSPSPLVTYSAIDFLGSGVLQRPDPQLDAPPGQTCQGKHSSGSASLHQRERGWGSHSPGTGTHLRWAMAENPPLPPGNADR